jgi:hypothetical protein
LINARHRAAGAFDFEANHFEQVTERFETVAARHGGEIGRQSCHVVGYRRPIARFTCHGLAGHCNPCRRAQKPTLIVPASAKIHGQSRIVIFLIAYVVITS